MDWLKLLLSGGIGGLLVGGLAAYYQMLSQKRTERRETAVLISTWYYDAQHLMGRLRFDERARSINAVFMDQDERAVLVERLFVHLMSGTPPAVIGVTFGESHRIHQVFGRLQRLLTLQVHALQADPPRTREYAERELSGEFDGVTFPTDHDARVDFFDGITDAQVEPLRQELISTLVRSVDFSQIASEWIG